MQSNKRELVQTLDTAVNSSKRKDGKNKTAAEQELHQARYLMQKRWLGRTKLRDH